MKHTIIVDTREQAPLPFPSVVEIDTAIGPTRHIITTSAKPLSFGDYVLSCPRPGAIIERKGTPRELHECVLGGRIPAFKRQLEGIADSAPCPFLLVEFSLDSIMASRWREIPRPNILISRLYRLCATYGVTPVFASGYRMRNRVPVGELAARILLSCEHTLRRSGDARHDQQPRTNDPR